MKRLPVLLICMGVSGSGKSTLAKFLADEYDFKFYEADDFHGDESRALMAAGTPLTDAMREPWIDRVCAALAIESERGCNCTLAYSGLRRAQRQRFRELGFKTYYLYLEGEKGRIRARMENRAGHYMPSELLDSQYRDMQGVDGENDIIRMDTGCDLLSMLETAKKLTDSILNADEIGRTYE